MFLQTVSVLVLRKMSLWSERGGEEDDYLPAEPEPANSRLQIREELAAFTASPFETDDLLMRDTEEEETRVKEGEEE